MKNVMIFVDLDLVIRAFIKSGAFKKIDEKYNVTYIFHKYSGSDAHKSHINVDVNELGLNDCIKLETERKREGYWYFLVAATIMNLQKSKENYKALRKTKFVKDLGERNTKILEILSLPIIYNIFRWAMVKFLGTSSSIEEFILDKKPDLIIYPSVLAGPFMNELLVIINKRNIPFIICMNSWDNPTSKALCIGVPDKLIVWGEQSRNDAIEYMGIPKRNIGIFGAAQFQLYRTKSKESREELCEIFTVPKDKRIILYAGVGASLYETKYLKMLEYAVKQNILKDCHILYRPHPWRGATQEGEENFFDMKWEHVSMDPHMPSYYKNEIENPSKKFFMIDYQITNQILTLSDAVISPRSTVLLEAIIKGKPVLVFFPEDEQEGKIYTTEDIHFRDFYKIELVNVCLDKNDFYNKCKILASQIGDQKISEALRHDSEYFCLLSGSTYNERLKELANDLISNK